MKIYAALLFAVPCIAMEDVALHDGKPYTTPSSVILINTQPALPRRPGPKHPSVIEAHKRAEREQAERDTTTCCCFFKMKKKN